MSVPFPTPEGPTTTSGRGMALDRAFTRPSLRHHRRDRARVDAPVRVLSPRVGASPRPPSPARARASILVGALQTVQSINRQSSRACVVVGIARAGEARDASRRDAYLLLVLGFEFDARRRSTQHAPMSEARGRRRRRRKRAASRANVECRMKACACVHR